MMRATTFEEIADYYDVQYETSTNDLFARMTKKL